MKKKFTMLMGLSSFLYSTAPFADLATLGSGNEDLQKIRKYMLYLDKLFGIDPDKFSDDQQSQDSNAANLQTSNANIILQTTLKGITVPVVTNLLGAFTVNSFTPSFVPGNLNIENGDTYNQTANNTFKLPELFGNTVSTIYSGGGQFKDPVNNAIFSMINSPDYTFCNYDDQGEIKPLGVAACQNNHIKTQQEIMFNALGFDNKDNIPRQVDKPMYPLFGATESSISDLNINSLISPLIYSAEKNQESSQNSAGSSGSAAQKKSQGLASTTQIEQANNFILYASGMVNPVPLPSEAAYQVVRKQVNDVTPIGVKAKAKLADLFTSLKVFTAQNSVGLSNLYFILSKRMPQVRSVGADKDIALSQAYNEFKMATWRLFSQNGDTTQWQKDLNSASSITVQKEIAVLLAEINYQLYLNRMQDERSLLTQSVILMQSTRALSKPSSSLEDSGR